MALEITLGIGYWFLGFGCHALGTYRKSNVQIIILRREVVEGIDEDEEAVVREGGEEVGADELEGAEAPSILVGSVSRWIQPYWSKYSY